MYKLHLLCSSLQPRQRVGHGHIDRVRALTAAGDQHRRSLRIQSEPRPGVGDPLPTARNAARTGVPVTVTGLRPKNRAHSASPTATWSANRPAQRFALPGTAFDSWISAAVPRRRNHRAANNAGTDVNPPIPSTTSGSNSSQATAQSARSLCQAETKVCQPGQSLVAHRGHGLHRD